MKHWCSIQGIIAALTLLTAARKVSGCEKPSAPQCFRRHSEESVYICEWTTSGTDQMFDLHFSNDKTFPDINLTSTKIREEELFVNKIVDIWVEAHKGTSRCSSNKTSVKLSDSIKYDRPQNVSVSWSQDNLSLSWRTPENHQALAEVWHRKDSTETWHTLQRTTTLLKDQEYEINVTNLRNHSADQLQIRHRSAMAKNPMWSDWSNILTVPIVWIKISKKKFPNGTRRVTLKWKPVPYADGEAELYQVETQTFEGCPCQKWKRQGNTSMCNETVLKKKPRTCSVWYELQEGAIKHETVIIITPKINKTKINQIMTELKDFLPYIYFKHECVNNQPKTVKMCRYYKNEEKPESFPLDFTVFDETHNSATVSWIPIPMVHQRGFITHYKLCIVKNNLKPEQEVTDKTHKGNQTEDDDRCRNISASLRSYNLKNLTPGTNYNITLVGVTRIGEGPKARVIFKTLPEKPVNVWLSLGLLLSFFIVSTSCTVVLKRIKNKIFPPLPTPVIPEFLSSQAELQDMLERKEEVHEVTLVQLHPEFYPTEDRDFQRGKLDDGSEVDEDNEEEDDVSKAGSDDIELTLRDSTEELTDLDQVQSEIAILIYRNGLVFDVIMDSS